MWDPQPPGAVQACQGIALHLPLRVCVTSTSSAVLTPGANTIGRSVEPRLGLECLEERKFLDISAHSGPGSVVGIATDYGLVGPGIETLWGARFSAPVQSGLGPHPASWSCPGLPRDCFTFTFTCICYLHLFGRFNPGC